MKKIVILAAGAGAAVLALSAGAYAMLGSSTKEGGHLAMVGTDFGKIRREALAMHPVGSDIADVARGMIELGFHCYYQHHVVPNITAPTVVCASQGRGGPMSSRVSVILVARNAVLTDVVVSDGLDLLEASAMTPDPNPDGQLPSPEVQPLIPDPQWDRILGIKRVPDPRTSETAPPA